MFWRKFSVFIGSFLLVPALSAADIPKLFNTGVGTNGVSLAAETLDPHYRLVASDDPEYPGPDAFTLAPGFPVGPWIAETDISRWIGPRPEQGTGNAEGNYTYETTFDLTGFDAATAQITGRWSVDNAGVDIILNGANLGLANAAGFGGWTDFTITSGFIPGVNTIQFVVNNAPATPNPTGLRVEMSGRVTSAGESPSIVTQVKDQSVLVGEPISLSLQAVGPAPLNYQWRFNGNPISGATQANYTISSATTNNTGIYSVAVSNTNGQVVSTNATVTVLVPFPGIYNTGVNDNRQVLDDLVLDTHYQLTVNPTDPSSTSTYVEDSTVFPIVDGPWLRNSTKSKWIGPLSETSGAETGDYTYTLFLNLTGYDSATAFLAGSWASDNAGSIFLNGADTGFKSPGFSAFSTFNITNGFISGTNRLEFRVNNAGTGYTGLRVENLRGTAQVKAGSGGEAAPRIVTQPRGATKIITDKIAFMVVSDANPAATYQWFKDGSAISGATNATLNIDRILTKDAGTYSVRASNSLGSAQSDNAILQVIQPELGLFNTGVDSSGNALAGGAQDPHYLLLASGDPAFPGPATYVPASAPIPPWVANEANSAWIGPRSAATEAAPGAYRYRLIFNVASNEVATAALSASIATDDGNGGIFLNGNPIDFGASAFTTYAELIIPEGSPFVAGLNTLDFVVNNGGAAANPTGLHVNNLVVTGITQQPAPAQLTITREGTSVTITWTGSGTLQSADLVTGPYTNVTGATGNSFTTSTTSPKMKFYRVVRP